MSLGDGDENMPESSSNESARISDVNDCSPSRNIELQFNKKKVKPSSNHFDTKFKKGVRVRVKTKDFGTVLGKVHSVKENEYIDGEFTSRAITVTHIHPETNEEIFAHTIANEKDYITTKSIKEYVRIVDETQEIFNVRSTRESNMYRLLLLLSNNISRPSTASQETTSKIDEKLDIPTILHDDESINEFLEGMMKSNDFQKCITQSGVGEDGQDSYLNLLAYFMGRVIGVELQSMEMDDSKKSFESMDDLSSLVPNNNNFSFQDTDCDVLHVFITSLISTHINKNWKNHIKNSFLSKEG